jgi:hypothetical protein
MPRDRFTRHSRDSNREAQHRSESGLHVGTRHQ